MWLVSFQFSALIAAALMSLRGGNINKFNAKTYVTLPIVRHGTTIRFVPIGPDQRHPVKAGACRAPALRLAALTGCRRPGRGLPSG